MPITDQSVIASQTTGTVIELAGVRVTYPSGVTALYESDLAIDRGSVTVLLGPSGAGKSTLLRTLNLLVPPSAGHVRSAQLGVLEGKETIRQHRCGCAMIFQQHQLIGRLTALQNVLTGRLGHHTFMRSLFPLSEIERRLALSCLDRVGLLEKALSRCDQLSGGQQQRVGIARALAQEPSMILADEPVASLDPAASQRVLTKLREICREDGTPVVISLHQLDYAREIADRIVGLSNGRVVFDGAPSQLDDQAVQRIYHS
ncbi:MAG: phosphonate ABC transporter ATP-binding protein [Burkholderiaceae bacterium]